MAIAARPVVVVAAAAARAAAAAGAVEGAGVNKDTFLLYS
jgi:hypothetical protein